MKYTIAKMFQILRHNRWVSILMIIEIALGMSVFTYSLNMFFSLSREKENHNGVEKGIERVSKFIMPVLLIMVIGIAIFSLTLKTTLDDGTVRTGLQGLKVYMKPDLTGITIGRFLQITLDAMSQLFFSLSVSMGIMITYGSYVKKDVDLNKAVSQIEIMDTGVAFLAGVMIIPAVFVFSGLDGMSAGPGQMLVSLPKVFYCKGVVLRRI